MSPITANCSRFCARAVDVRADIEQHCRISRRSRENRGQRGTIHARNRAQHDFRRGHGRAGIAGSDEARGLSLAHHAQADAHGGIALGANRLHLVFHGNEFAGVDDFDGQARRRGVAIQFRLDHIFRADQQHAHAILARRLYGALNLRLGSAVGTHRIQRDHARHGVFELAGFFDVEDFASFIVTALGAGAVRHLFLVAVGALGQGCGAFSESWARRVEVRFWECRRFGLGMVFKFLSRKPRWPAAVKSYNSCQLSAISFQLASEALNADSLSAEIMKVLSVPACCESPASAVHRGSSIAVRAGTLSFVQILAAMHAQAFAVFAAGDLQGQRQQHLLAQNIFEQKAVPLIIADLGFRVGHRKLVASRIGPERPVQQFELASDLLRHRFHAARALQLKPRRSVRPAGVYP